MKTDHILFMAAGAFHVSKPSDLIPELQGRFPIRVELSSLTKDDLRSILTEPRQALIRQYTALLETEDIGARRLYTILERVLEDLSFDAPDLEDKHVTIDESYVRNKLGDVTENIDISNYIL